MPGIAPPRPVLLPQVGADRDPIRTGGSTPPYCAAQCGKTENMKAPLCAGAQVGLTSTDGSIAGVTFRRAEMEYMELLLRVCANKEARNLDSMTPLHWRQSCENKESMILLLRSDVNKDARTIWALHQYTVPLRICARRAWSSWWPMEVTRVRGPLTA